ncbi:LacI family DNA-binding transcriptional regulator [Melghirimyces algeriensis]|uniref:Catabolite control protein A n=1 Tax=Melghirimyces algeriensis TaxID=910412 RepID=A0A521F1R6_9BACL|nr:LacI family DNA-binding transcriptional regulator [Melghirimyces algeriensis]SMO90047.1 transcriptional regulator, LacI family [Melghirimyces algeriensis]
MATIRDVAQRAGVSVATVSRVLNQNGYVNQDTEARVMKVIKELDYRPNTVARSLANRKTGTIALILPTIMNPFFSELSRAVEDSARSRGFTVIFCNSDDLDTREQTYIDVLRQKYIDGIIFASSSLGEEDLAVINENGIPLVVLDRALREGNCSVIRSKNAEGARKAVHHLLATGCRKVAHIAGPQELITAQERLRGYRDVVKDLDWFEESLILPGQFSITGGKGAVQALVEAHPDVDGIFAGNDLMAIGALKALHRMGIKVPEEVSLCGFDGIGATEWTEPELTTVAQLIYEMGARAALHLIDRVQGYTDQVEDLELDVHLIERGSTRRRKY